MTKAAAVTEPTICRFDDQPLTNAIALVFIEDQWRPANDYRYPQDEKGLQAFHAGDKTARDLFRAEQVWRRTHPEPPVELRDRACEEVARFLEIPVDDLTAEYQRDAGCAICPCSPGYVVRSPRYATEYGPAATDDGLVYCRLDISS